MLSQYSRKRQNSPFASPRSRRHEEGQAALRAMAAPNHMAESTATDDEVHTDPLFTNEKGVVAARDMATVR